MIKYEAIIKKVVLFQRIDWIPAFAGMTIGGNFLKCFIVTSKKCVRCVRIAHMVKPSHYPSLGSNRIITWLLG